MLPTLQRGQRSTVLASGSFKCESCGARPGGPIELAANSWRHKRGEDTKRNLKHAKDRRHDTLCSAIALDDGQDRILAQPEPMTNLPIRLAFADKL
jgi:hypothetical protein